MIELRYDEASRTSFARKVWNAMKRRCDDPANDAYANYGGRGITYDERWKVFENFVADMGDVPEGMSLERVDNNGNYCKSNCEWRSMQDQNRNRRSTTLTLDDAIYISARVLNKEKQRTIAEEYGISEQLVSDIKHGRAWIEAMDIAREYIR